MTVSIPELTLKYLIGILLSSFPCLLYAQDSIQVYFLHGSKPAKGYKKVEEKWFGGRLGGHAGVALNGQDIVSFVPAGKFHYIGKRGNRHSRYISDTPTEFLEMFGGKVADMRYTIITIPIDTMQARKLADTQAAYLAHTPYDYAFLGMRCGAATYDMLSKINIVKRKSRFCTIFKIFYPKRVRKKLLRKARKYHWKVTYQAGTTRRKWER